MRLVPDHLKGVKIGIKGCIVNGPGESKHANIGISLPGTGEDPSAPVFIDGKKELTLRGDDLALQFQHIVAHLHRIATYLTTHRQHAYCSPSAPYRNISYNTLFRRPIGFTAL